MAYHGRKILCLLCLVLAFSTRTLLAQSFAPAVNYNAGSDLYAVQAADVNSDGKIDLVTVSQAAHCANVLLGNGDGTFQALTSYPVGDRPAALQVADFNGDGKLDLVVTNYSS